MLAVTSVFVSALPLGRYAAPPAVPTVTIATSTDGSTIDMPLVGIGTWQYNDSVTELALLSALKMGYEHIDTALGYENAAGVAAALEKSGRKRESYFITSKIPGGLNESAATAAIDSNVAALKLDYVDLMMYASTNP